MTAQHEAVAAGSSNKYQKTIIVGSARLCGHIERGHLPIAPAREET